MSSEMQRDAVGRQVGLGGDSLGRQSIEMRRHEILHGADAESARENVGSRFRSSATRVSALDASEDSANENRLHSGSGSASAASSERRQLAGTRTEQMV